MADIEMFGTDREDIKTRKFNSYKGEGGKTDLLGIVFPDGAKAKFCGTRVHYHERYFICKSKWEKDKLVDPAVCCTATYKGKQAKYRVGAVIIVYRIGKDPETDKDKLMGYELMPWIFGEGIYEQLQSTDKEFSLESHDIKVKCTNADFQNMDIKPTAKSIWRSNEKLKEKVLAQFESKLEDAKKGLASDFSLEEIKEHLGIETPGAEDAAVDINMSDVVGDI